MASKTNGMEWVVVEPLPKWLRVDEMSGSGSTVLSISADTASSYDDDGTKDHPYNLQISGSNGSITSISVTRCVIPVCDEDYSPKNQTIYIDECGGSYDFTITHTLADCSEEPIRVNGSVGMNCDDEKTIKELYNNKNELIYRVIQRGGCDNPDCYGDCLCTPEYAQKDVPTVSCDAQSVTIVYEITGFTNCDNPNCDSRIGETASTSVEVGCNSESSTVDRTGSTSYGAWTVHQEGGCQCGECLYKCSDFISFEAYNMPLPAEGGRDVPVGIWRYHYIEGGRGDYAQGLGVIVETENQNIIDGNGNGFLYFGSRQQDSTSYYKILYAKKINENTSTESRTSELTKILKYHCAEVEYDYDTRNEIPDEIKCGYFDNVTITQEGKAVTYCECYKDITVSPVTASSYSDTSATITWTYTHRKADGTTETGSSSTPVSFEANDTTSTVTRTGSTAWSSHKLCNGNECGDDAVINWEVSVPGKPAEPDFSTKIDVGVHSDYGTRMCDYETDIDTNYISVNRGGLDIDIAGNFTGDAYIKFYPDADSRTQLARDEDRMKYIIWQTGDTISRIEGGSWDEVDSTKFETFGEVTYGGPQSTITLNSGGKIRIEFWIQERCQ